MDKVTKEELLTLIDALLADAMKNGDADAQQAAITLRSALVVSAAGLDERFMAENVELFAEATAEAVRDEFGGSASTNPEKN